jgi:hypothetical protein
VTQKKKIVELGVVRIIILEKKNTMRGGLFSSAVLLEAEDLILKILS